MACDLGQCVRILKEEKLRHHVDDEQGLLRLVFVTSRYRSLRGERLAIVQVATPADGRRCRVTIERAFPPGDNAAATCLALCRAAAETPLVNVEFDADFENLRMVVDAVVEDGDLTRRQLLSMIDAVVDAAECWQAAVPESLQPQIPQAAEKKRSRGGRRHAA